ncbi:hypothetical protein D3C80_1987820 [compost metagenome]
MLANDLGNEPTNVWALMSYTEFNGIETITTGMAITGGVLVKNVTIVRESKGFACDKNTVGTSESTVFIPGVELVRSARAGFYEINYMPGNRN